MPVPKIEMISITWSMELFTNMATNSCGHLMDDGQNSQIHGYAGGQFWRHLKEMRKQGKAKRVEFLFCNLHMVFNKYKLFYYKITSGINKIKGTTILYNLSILNTISIQMCWHSYSSHGKIQLERKLIWIEIVWIRAKWWYIPSFTLLVFAFIYFYCPATDSVLYCS